MSTISKFGFSSDNNNSVGVVGPRGPTGAKGDKGDTGEKGADAVFPLALNYADISGIASLTGPPDANSTIYINSNLDFNGYNSLYNVSSISAYDAIGQPLTITGSMQVNGSVQISQNITNTLLTANKFLKTDEGKTVTSTDIQINDVKDLSTRLSNVEAKNTFQNLSIYGTLTMTKQILYDVETNIVGNGLSILSVNPANNINNGIRLVGWRILMQSNSWINLNAGSGGVIINNNQLTCNSYYPDGTSTPNNGTLTLYGANTVINGSLTLNTNMNANNKDIINVKDLIFQGGLLIPSSIGAGTNGQVLSSDGKTAIWKNPNTDIQINDVNGLSTRLLLNESNIQNISVTSTGDAFTAPNQGASLIHTTSTNPTFKIKGLTSSNNILLGVSANSVDIKIDPALTTRIDNIEAKNTFQNLYSTRSLEINPWAVLYRTHGTSAVFDIKSGTTFVNVTNGQLAKGNKTIPAGGLVAGDLYKFTLIGAMTSDANVNMTFHIFSGATRILTYTAVGDALYNQGFEFSTTVHVTNPLANVALLSGMGKYEKDGKSPSYVQSANITNLTISSPHTFDIYIKPASTMVNGAVSIFRYIIETI